MSSKKLTELEWKNFAKGKKLDDKDFLKALASLETAQRARDPATQLTALDALEKQTARLRSANKADKEIAKYLDEVDKDLGNERKPLEAEVRNAAKKAEQSAGGDEDEGPAALTTKMLPVMRQVPKAEVAMQALVGTVGKLAAVLVSRRAIGASQRKLLLEELGVSSGVKFMPGECIWEANAHTFVLEAKVANLAKLLKAALFKQTGVKFKVRVRGIDPSDVDEDGDDVEGAEGAEVHDAGTTAPAPSGEPPEKALYLARIDELRPRIATALQGSGGEVGKIRAVLAFAEGKAAENAFKAALHALDSLLPLLGAAPAGTAGQTDMDAEFKRVTAELAKLAPLIQQGIVANPGRRQETAAAVTAVQQMLTSRQLTGAKDALLQLGRLLLALRTPAAAPVGAKPVKVPTQPLMPIWADASESVIDQTTEIIVKLRAYGDSELDRMADDLLETVNGLLDEVDDALGEYEGMTAEERSANAREALDFLRAHKSDIDSDPLIRAADRNPLGVKAELGRTMGRALDEIAAAFEA